MRSRKPRQPVLLRYSPLGKRVYVLTRYTVKRTPGGKEFIVASVKHDVTEDYKALRKMRVRVT